MKTALISGVSGQDGAYLAKLLLGKGYACAALRATHGYQRSVTFERLGIRGQVQLESVALNDWGWAPEYVKVMHLMLQQEYPDDFVIATEESHKLADFATVAFEHLGLKSKDYLVVDRSLFPPIEIMIGRGNASKSSQQIGMVSPL